MTSAIQWRKPFPLSRKELVSRLYTRLAGRVSKAFLFGSHATGESHAESDIDLILVCESDRHPTERFRDFLDLYEDFSSLDLVIYTPEEWHQLQDNPTALIAEARSHWVPVIESLSPND